MIHFLRLFLTTPVALTLLVLAMMAQPASAGDWPFGQNVRMPFDAMERVPAPGGLPSTPEADVLHPLSGGDLRDLLDRTGLQPTDPYREALDRGFAAYQAGDCAAALAQFKPVIEDPRFAGLGRTIQQQALALTFDCALKTRDYAYAFAVNKRLLTYQPKNMYLLKMQLQLAVYLEDGAAWQETLILISEAWRGALNQVELTDILRGLSLLDNMEGGEARQLAVLDLLLTKDYKPKNPLADLEELRVVHVMLLIRAGRTDEIVPLVDGITRPFPLVVLYVNRDTEAVWTIPSFAARTSDWMASANAALAARQAKMTAHPDRLEAVVYVLEALTAVGRAEEAASLGETTSRNLSGNIIYTDLSDASEPVQPASGQPATYKDIDDYQNWFLNMWANALYSLGRNEEARAVMEQAAAADEKGSRNVSQVINFAMLLLREGALDESLKVIGTVPEDRTSPFGMMFVHQIRACIHLLRDEPDKAAPHMAYVEENRARNGGAYALALLCADNKDTFAQIHIEDLRDPKKRVAALSFMVNFEDYDTEQLPVWDLLVQRLADIFAREDVRTEALKVGRIADLPLYESF